MTSKSSSCCSYKHQPSKTHTPKEAPGELSTFDVPKMDCPSEEGLIRTAFASLGEAVAFDFDLPNRKVSIYHAGSPDKVAATMKSLGLDAHRVSHKLINSESAKKAREVETASNEREASVLKWLLGINVIMFFFELTVGIAAQSAGLIADSLDMFADAAVYVVALYAVGKAAKTKLRAAHLSGWLELFLAIGLLIEVVRRVILGGAPASMLMMGVGSLALIANIACLVLIYQVRNNGTHLKASMIFSANDVIANAGVIIAGALVAITGSQIPDLIIGAIVGIIVLGGARRILLLR